ncbi:Protein CASP [Quillaja saponaria]|uniref:Protein CASP n=1 Tax=Quillaja saponaria TaxID=32244 RepID=A0AAD7M6I8_QUISA|nr:Protein CASP [Quillaja saponaria]
MEAVKGGSERDKSNSSPNSVISGFWKGRRITENQENSQKNRRKLAESTRDFKKVPPEEKLSLFNSLLKGYQEEVDNITKRAKFGENAFLNIYQKLCEAPDPYPALASIAEQDDKLSELESENRKMKSCRWRIKYKRLWRLSSTVGRREPENTGCFERKASESRHFVYVCLEQALQDQLRQAKGSVSNMQKIHELAQSQLFELRAQSEEERAAKQSEVNLLMDEVERAQTRLLSLEREKGVLCNQLQSANDETGSKKSDNFDSNNALENSLNAKEKIISELNMELHDIETTIANEREQHMIEIKKLKALLHDKEAALEEIKKELHARPTAKMVDDLWKKVKILVAVAYNSIEAEDWEVATSGEEMSKMESLLLDKNRKMEHDLTQLKVKISEKTSLLETTEQKIAELTAKVNEQQKLIQKLEDDILKGYSSKDRKDRRGNKAVEGEDRGATLELEKTKADNVKLYGKIHYVQDYNLEKVVSRGSKKHAEDLESGFISDVESKYKKIYEDDINPFAAFSKKERDQRYKELGFRDRITLSSGRFLLGNKYA